MPRARNWSQYKDGTYHIISRAIRKWSLFEDYRDKDRYLTILEETQQKYPFKLHAFCLMKNHVHLLIEVMDHQPNVIMKQINFRYARYFNFRHKHKGHLFEGRYFAEPISTVSKFLNTSRYIHLNPYKALAVKQAEDYKWSSYPYLVKNLVCPILYKNKTLSHFSPPYEENFKHFTEELKWQDKEELPSL
ncbi:transposase [Bacillus sp. FJAT-42376]|uniref:transposase n=1 Tax=Bacillus sp. FJAT-42376 TaxID=2014076 RepID=UPI000F4E98DF|nr:transposase [Bacillus sp. FJAT-42376]AZB44273.1 transposase [Bacillus sp. FJAT-42376]